MIITDEERIKLLKKFFEEDAYAAISGMFITGISKETAFVEADIKDIHYNADKVAQGGMIYTLADFAFAVISNYLHPKTVTQSGHITYLRPAACKHLKASAREIARNGHNSVGEVIVENECGDIICVASFNGFIKDVSFEEFIKRFI